MNPNLGPSPDLVWRLDRGDAVYLLNRFEPTPIKESCSGLFGSCKS